MKITFPAYFSRSAMGLYLILIILCLLLFPNPLPFIWIGFGLVAVFMFFYFSTQLTSNWYKSSEKNFIRKAFLAALIIRLIYVVFIYFFYDSMTGQPFEFGVADSMNYHHGAIWRKNLLLNNTFAYYWNDPQHTSVSDDGWPLILSMIYLIFGDSVIIPRIFNALIGAWMVVFIYKLTKRNFGDNAARIAAVMAVLLPNFIYYTGLHLKETFMVFLVVAFIERSDLMLRRKSFSVNELLVVAFLGSFLFFFRTVLGAAAVFSVVSAIIFSRSKIMNKSKRIIAITWIFILGIIIAGSVISDELFQTSEQSDTLQQENMIQRSSRGNTLAKYGDRSVFLPIILFAPFPTLVNTEQTNAMLLNGAMFTRNVYAFFVILALITIFKRKLLRNHVILLVFIASYLFILATSSFAISERFHMPVLPFLIILSAYGVTLVSNKNKQFFVPYMIVIILLIIGWNWFKLAGRGVI